MAPKKPARLLFRPASGVQGNIVGARPDAAGLVLYLDKGAAAGVKVGQRGFVLQGAAGAVVMPGGLFVVNRVVDKIRSIGHTRLRSLRRNTRMGIETGGRATRE